MGFGACGIVTLVNVLRREIVSELDLGEQYSTNDIIKLKL